MSDDRKPVADIIAIVERPNDRRSSDFVTIGALWMTESGNLNGKMNAEPIAWRDPAASRQVMIRIRDGWQILRAAGSVSSRSLSRPVERDPEPEAEPDPF